MLLNPDFLDPQMAGLAGAAGILGKMSGPTAAPVGIGSILGQVGAAAFQGNRKALVENEKMAQSKMLREAQAADLAEKVTARKLAAEEIDRKRKSQEAFRSALAETDDPSDPINVLGAGVRTGALEAKDYSRLIATVQEKQAARQQRIQELQMRLADQKIAREDRETFQRSLLTMQSEARESQARLVAALRPKPQEPVVPVQKDGRTVYVPRSEAIGQVVPPRNTGDKLSESEAKGTLFFRQMRSAEGAAAEIAGQDFDVSKIGSQIGMKLTDSNLTNWMASPNAQRYSQAAEQWAEAYLRLKTGAATNRDEIKRNARAYFPQPGDSKEVIAQKNSMRKKAIEDVSIVAGRGVEKEPNVSDEADKDPWEQ